MSFGLRLPVLSSGSFVFVVAAVVSLPFELQAFADSVPGELLVKTKSLSSLSRALEKSLLLNSLLANRTAIFSSSQGNIYKVKFDSNVDSPERAAQELMRSGSVEWAEPNYILHTQEVRSWAGPLDNPPPSQDPALEPVPAQEGSSDGRLFLMWALAKLQAKAAWAITKASPNIVVANIDTGIDYNHEDLRASLWTNTREVPNDGKDNDGNGFIDDAIGWDFYGNDALPFDNGGHGTHTAGTIAAGERNTVGVAGMAPKAQLMTLRFIDGVTGEGTTEDAVKSIQYAVKNGATILSNSWGGDEFSKALYEVVADAGKRGVTFVAAAGNSMANNDETPMYPASFNLPNVISVGATRKTDELAGYTNYGVKTVHIAAPGSGIYSTLPFWKTYKYGMLDGTSMACPHVSGAAALVKSINPKLSPEQIRKVIADSVDKVEGYAGKIKSGGRLNLLRAIQFAQASL